MYIDFALTSTDISESDTKKIINDLNNFPVNSVTAPYYLIKGIKSLVPNNRILSCLIDYPLGLSDLRTRRYAIEQAQKIGAGAVDIAMPQNLAANRKYDKIREDVKSAQEFAQSNNLQIRYVLEYRVFDHYCLKKLCEIFEDNQITHVYPSSGFFLDNLADNILASIFLHENSKDINVVSTGNIWNDKHFETIIKSGLFGFRTTSFHSLKNFVDFNSGHKEK